MPLRSTGRLVLAFAALAALATTSCGWTDTPREGPQPLHHKPTLLAAGTIAGMPYRLTVSSSYEGKLCMAVNDGSVPDGKTFAEYGCGFGLPDDKGATTFDVSNAGGIDLMWGPAPAGAVRVRFDSDSTPAQEASDSSALNVPGCEAETPAHLFAPITHDLPDWTTPGRWFLVPARTHHCGYFDAHFFDAHGTEIPLQNW